ncbi:hypothetical protein [Streptomyces sp. NBC_00859]|uniref:hypothetical protein n=1 Tax=Streptomyces sp. NBC_00859 TaxID=2903682 RepID=UPI0038656635|nr:hypothetical protein OG584_20175 [Streptomyces sp. NBC_00859]
MTQNGQGDEPQLPAVRRAHEGVVLPSDGSGPWIPEVAGEHTVPAGGQPWGQPWGPQDDQQQPPQQPPHIPQQPQDHQQYQPPHFQQQSQQPQAQQPQFPQHLPPQQSQPPQPYQQQPLSQPLPPPAQSSGQPTGHRLPQHGAPAPQYQQDQQYPQDQQQYPQAQQYPPHGQPRRRPQLPPQDRPQNPSFAQPLPPEAVPGAGDSDATQFIAPVSEATQFIAPVAAPPENPAESTQYLGHRRQPGPAPAASGADAEPTQFLPPVPAAPAAPDYGIRPGAPEDRRPPAEFDSLFRTDAAGPQAAGETQQLPRFDPQDPYGSDPYGRPQAQPQPQPGAPAPQYVPEPASRAAAGAGRRKSSRTPLIAAVVVGCAVIGLGAGALLSGGGGSDKKDDKQPAGATAATGSKAPAQPAKDPAQPQAVALDKLLADSNNSRSAVIAAVGNIRSCQNLPQAASDLRGAAKQRHSLVTQLGTLSVDKLPDHDKLTASLSRAWNSSASADEQYAAWAHAVAANNKKECKKGHAKRTAAAGRGDAASGQATAAKKQASTLWNAIADKYSLTQRRSDQL